MIVPAIAEYMGEVIAGMPRESIKDGMMNAKEAIKSKYLGKRVIKNPLDKRKKIVFQTGTADLDTHEFKDFVDAILKDFPWIPKPDDGESLKFYDEMKEKY